MSKARRGWPRGSGDAHGLFDRYWALRGMEAFLTDMVEHPTFAGNPLPARAEPLWRVYEAFHPESA